MKITVIGTGYVGLSNAILLAQNNEVTALDVIAEKVELINNKISPIRDKEIEEYFQNSKLNLKATLNIEEALLDSEYVIISTPTNYDDERDYFDTSTVEQSIENVLKYNKNAVMIIKSTIPVGYISNIKKNTE